MPSNYALLSRFCPDRLCAVVRAQAGLVGPNQVANAKNFLAQQEIQLLDLEEQLDRQSDRLGSLIGTRPQAGETRYITTDAPPGDFPIDSVDALVRIAKAAQGLLYSSEADYPLETFTWTDKTPFAPDKLYTLTTLPASAPAVP